MADIKDRAREYLAKHSEYSEVFGQTFVAVDTLTAMVEFAEQETKDLEESNKEWQRTCEAKSDTNSQLTEQLANKAERIAELEAQIEKLKSVVISERDEALRVEDVITYSVLNDIIDKLEIKEK